MAEEDRDFLLFKASHPDFNLPPTTAAPAHAAAAKPSKQQEQTNQKSPPYHESKVADVKHHDDGDDDGTVQLTLVPESIDFGAEEAKVLEYWEAIKAFERSYQQSIDEGRPEYSFYDGPPFATGLPHYGHILAGSIKDVVTRWAHQTGYRVKRRFGWDCHGLPVEYEIDKKLEIKSGDDVMAMGIDKYNAECRSIVMRYASEWEVIVKRMGRWIDFKNDYKTLDTSFMETVWWVFKQMFDKQLVYQGFRVMPYSTACHTPLSNFEAGQNYQDVNDPAVVVSFPVTNGGAKFSGCHLLAWTTTPWTLPSNLALCVNAEFDYVVVNDAKMQKKFILCEKRLEELYNLKKKDEFTRLSTVKGKDLVGLTYKPLFPYFEDEAKNSGAFRVVADGYVTDDSGTGIVHQAPAFGEDDYRVCLTNGIVKKGAGIICPVDDSGRFVSAVADFKGVHVKEADKDIIAYLKDHNRLVRNKRIVHSYPFCWRSDTPLIYKAVPSWFVDVPKIKDRLLANNDQTYWVPGYVKEKRFHNWLVNAREWAISRNRYWGTPLPIWTSDDGEEVVVVGSIAELEALTGATGVNDLHRDKIDHLTMPSRQGKGVLKRVPEVFDCWFESGSMPYAQQHYPFENKEEFEHGFPANFIAEGLDQTRGWFYTLMVISTALFDRPAFQNLICNGLVLAEDGKKMSKRLKNYTDPMIIVNQFGADALRLYLITSPVVRAEPLRFKDDGVRDVLKEIFIPWFNTYRLFVSQARRLKKDDGVDFLVDANIYKVTDNVMDKWIISAFQSLVALVSDEMRRYRLDTVVPHLLKFIDQLSRWFVRFNKNRMKGDYGVIAASHSLGALYQILLGLCKLMAPFTPFFVDYMYLNLKKVLPASEQKETVHFCMIPSPNADAVDEKVEQGVSTLQSVIDLGRAAREKSKQPSFRFPYPELIVVHRNEEFLQNVKSLQSYVLDELNVRSVQFSSEVSSYISLELAVENASLGKKLKKKKKRFEEALSALGQDQIMKLQVEGRLRVDYHNGEGPDSEEIVAGEDVQVLYKFSGNADVYEAISSNGLVVLVNKILDESCVQEGYARELVARVQSARKEAKLTIEDKVSLYVEFPAESKKTSLAFRNLGPFINQRLRQDLLPKPASLHGMEVVYDSVGKSRDEDIRVIIVRQ